MKLVYLLQVRVLLFLNLNLKKNLKQNLKMNLKNTIRQHVCSVIILGIVRHVMVMDMKPEETEFLVVQVAEVQEILSMGHQAFVQKAREFASSV